MFLTYIRRRQLLTFDISTTNGNKLYSEHKKKQEQTEWNLLKYVNQF